MTPDNQCIDFSLEQKLVGHWHQELQEEPDNQCWAPTTGRWAGATMCISSSTPHGSPTTGAPVSPPFTDKKCETETLNNLPKVTGPGRTELEPQAVWQKPALSLLCGTDFLLWWTYTYIFPLLLYWKAYACGLHMHVITEAAQLTNELVEPPSDPIWSVTDFFFPM